MFKIIAQRFSNTGFKIRELHFTVKHSDQIQNIVRQSKEWATKIYVYDGYNEKEPLENCIYIWNR